jgi:hypothetical protein
MITVRGYRYSLARWAPITWMLALLAGAAVCHAVLGMVAAGILAIVTAVVVIAVSMRRGVDPPRLTLIAGAAWFITTAAVGLSLPAVAVLAVGVLVVGWSRLTRD